MQLQSRTITGSLVVRQTTQTAKTLSSSLKDDKGGSIPNVSPFRVVLKDYFKPLKHIHRDLDDEASIAVAGRYEDSISNDETTIWLRLTVQRTAGLFTRIVLKVKLLDPCDSGEPIMSMRLPGFSCPHLHARPRSDHGPPSC